MISTMPDQSDDQSDQTASWWAWCAEEHTGSLLQSVLVLSRMESLHGPDVSSDSPHGGNPLEDRASSTLRELFILLSYLISP